MSDAVQHLIQLVLLGTGGLLLAAQMGFAPPPRSTGRRALLAGLAIAAVVSVAAYFRMGQVHGYGPYGHRTFHYHDIYHYALGAKYYPELGYERLYDCSWVALQELAAAGVEVPEVHRLRSLAAPDTVFDPRPRAEELTTACHSAFTPTRWQAFATDLQVWLDMGTEEKWWRTMLHDLGFNPPPTWAVLAHSLLQPLPLTATTLEALPFIDVVLIFGVGGALVARAFGPWGVAAYLIVLGTNWVASYRWTGGSFCRQLWFAFTVYGVCLVQLRRYTASGVAFGLAVAMRLFPVVFLAGAVWALLRQARTESERRRDLAQLCGGAAVTVLVMVLLSLLLFDPTLWSAFFAKMDHHARTYFTWHIGFKKYAVYDAARVGAPALQDQLEGLYARRRLLYDLVRCGLSAGALALAWREPPARAALLVGSVMLFCFSMPANYYYVYLALLPAVFFVQPAGPVAVGRMLLIFGMLLSLSFSTWMGRLPLEQNGWIVTTMFWFFVLFLLTFVLERAGRLRERPAPGHL